MAKIDENLVKDEKILARAELNPAVLIYPIALLIIALLIGIAAGNFMAGIVLVIVVGCFGPFKRIFDFLTCEFSITTKRVYGRCKPKLIGYEELDTPIDKVNTLAVKKDLFGSILGYSTISITSFGEGWTFHGVKNAQELKNTFYENQK